jgi:hypothetical protein
MLEVSTGSLAFAFVDSAPDIGFVTVTPSESLHLSVLRSCAVARCSDLHGSSLDSEYRRVHQIDSYDPECNCVSIGDSFPAELKKTRTNPKISTTVRRGDLISARGLCLRSGSTG